MSETLIFAAVLIPSLIIAIVFHEVAHGWVALALGDPTAKEERRLSFNPIRHVDPVGTLVVPGLMAIASGPIFGWAKPVPVMKNRLNNPRYGMMAVGAAGPAMNFVLAFFGAVLLGLTMPDAPVFMAGSTGLPMISDQLGQSYPLATGAFVFITINIFLGLFNLLPIPPFDGSHIVEGLLPPSLARKYEALRPAGMLALFAIVALSWFAPGLGIIENVVLPPVNGMTNFYLGLADGIAALG